MEKNKGVGILGVNILYLITAILLLTLGSYYQYKDLKSGLLITEYILVLLPPLIYTKIRREHIKEVFRLKKLRPKHGVLIMGITILCYPVALFFNLIVMTLLSTLGKLEQPPIPTAGNFKEYIVFVIIIALSAGICEEVFFRGVVMYGYRRLGKTKAIIISAFLFGIFHFNIQNFAGPFVLGLIFGYLVYETDSIFAGIVGHATNNAVAVTLGFLTNLSNNNNVVEQMPNTLELIGGTIFIGIVAVISGFGALQLLKMIKKDRAYREEMEEIDTIKPSVFSFTPIFFVVILYGYLGYIQIMDLIS